MEDKKETKVTVTAEEVRAAAVAAGVRLIPLRPCSICLEWLHYMVAGGDLYFDPSCDCTRFSSGPIPHDWQSAADLINRQESIADQQNVMRDFGFADGGTVNVEVKTFTGMLPAAPGACPVCAGDHAPEQPHNQQSLFYQMSFYKQHGRFPTWADAMAHCTPEVQDAWRTALRERGIVLVPEEEEKRRIVEDVKTLLVGLGFVWADETPLRVLYQRKTVNGNLIISWRVLDGSVSVWHGDATENFCYGEAAADNLLAVETLIHKASLQQVQERTHDAR